MTLCGFVEPFVPTTVEDLDSGSELASDSALVLPAMELASDSAPVLPAMELASDSVPVLSAMELALASDSLSDSETVPEFDSASDSRSALEPSPEQILPYPLPTVCVAFVCHEQRASEQTNISSSRLLRVSALTGYHSCALALRR